MTAQAETLPDLADPQSPHARHARWFGWLFIVVVIVVAPLALILAAGVTVFLWWQLAEAKAAHEVDLEVARIQAQGEPVTIYDLYAFHRVPAGTKDITADWVAVLQMYGGGQMNADGQSLPIVGTGNMATLTADAEGSTLAAAEAYLQKYDAVVQATLTAGRLKGECRMPTAFENGAATILPQVQLFRSVARLMTLRVRVSAAQGDNDAAIESIETTFAAARAMEHQLTLVEQLVRIAIVGIALGDIEFLLNEADLTDQQLARLQAQLQALDIQDSFATSLVGERGVGFHAFHQFPPAPPPRVATAAVPMADGKLTRAADCKFYLLIMQDLIDASRQPPPKSLQNVKMANARVEMVSRSNPLAGMQYVLSVQILPAAHAAFIANARTHALRDLMLTAIAAKRYRLKHGEDPQDLESLTAEFLSAVPVDPYDGQSLRMKATEGELRLYSVGRDGKDDGGQSVDRSEPDIVVRLKTTQKP